jgi:hypothetical protein
MTQASGDLSVYLLRAENGGFDWVPVGSPEGSAMWDSVNAVVGWDHLTPQGIRIGIASFIALTVLAPGRPTGFEVLFNTVLMAAAAVLVAQAISLG